MTTPKRLASLVAVTLAACAGIPQPSEGASDTEVRFVKPPFVVVTRDSVHVWVRLNRPLRRNGRYPGEYRDFNAFLDIPGTRDDLRGLYRISRRSTCYGELLGDVTANGIAHDGGHVKVSLVLHDDVRITATAHAEQREPTAGLDDLAARRLHCTTRQAAGLSVDISGV